MKKRNYLYTFFAIAMVLLMAIVLIPANTYAEAIENKGVHAEKKIEVKEDGTYVIDLEAWATGKVTTTVSVKPCDLVLVLDASSSMGMTGANYLMEDKSVRIQALVDAVNAFLATVADKNKENAAAGADLSKVAIVLFSDSSNTGKLYDFTEITEANLKSNSVYATYSGTTYSTTGYGTSGKGFALHNYTWTDKGLSQADTLLETLMNSKDPDGNPTYDKEARNRVVVMFTDGYPNHSGGVDNFDVAAARDVVTNASTIKTSRQASLFSIAVLGSVAQPELNPTSTSQQTYGGESQMRVNQMLHAASSNYPQASVSSTWNVNWGSGGNYQGGYYKSAKTADDLKNIFKDIAESSASTETPLTAESVMKDIVASSFTLPEGADVNTIDVSIVPWDSTNHTWSKTTKYTIDGWKTACKSYGAESTETVAVSISEDGKTIDITGFDYGTHFLATSDPTQDINNINKNSAKVVVSFPIQARPSAITGSSVATNGEDSGLYIDGNATDPLIRFPQPEVTFTPVTYVVDYVTSDTSHDTKASTVKLDYSKVLNNVQMLDDPSDDYLIGEEAVDFEYSIYKGKYGTISFGDDELDVQRRYVRYAPTTMNWDGYDRIFVKGESSSDSNLDVWAMLCVIPANSVFYEDTYITQTKTVTYNNQTVEIKYTGIGYDASWETVGTEGKNQTQHAGDEMGWVDGLADDSNYANDMAHKSETAKAKATFTFTGTGVDIYSRTNGSTGTINVKLQGVNPETGKKITKLQNLDTKAAAGDFFATPVCTFTDLAYGEYTVTITVTTAGQSEDRMTFYLDGVRVYNPIQPLESEENVQKMYTDKHLGAVFTEVRSMLLNDPEKNTASALYIDEYYISETVPDVAAIRDAAAALSEAQKDRDKYVEEHITVAKNKISEEEYALAIADSDKTNAANIYDVAQAAYDKDPTQENLEALNKAKQKKEDAEKAYDEALAHYNEVMPGLQNDLNDAINGRAEKDAAVEAARLAYENASEGTLDVAYNNGTIAQYTKDGPKHEVLLSKGQKVALSVESGKTYYVGLKSLNGNKVTAKIGDQTVELSHSVDLYYEVTPVKNTIVIENPGDNILSVTKLRASGTGNTKSGLRIASTEETMEVVSNLAKMAVTGYTGDILDVEEDAEEPAIQEGTETMLDESDIAIDNPEAEKETDTVQTDSSAAGNWVKLLSSFSKFFKR